MAVQPRNTREVPGLPLAGWDETKRVILPGGGTMSVPFSFVSANNPKERTPKYVWRGGEGEGSIALELIAYHHAAQIDRARFDSASKEGLKPGTAPSVGALVGEIESLTVGGCATIYARYRLAPTEAAPEPLFAAYARILTPNAGLLFEATHPDLERVDQLAKAIFATLTFSTGRPNGPQPGAAFGAARAAPAPSSPQE